MSVNVFNPIHNQKNNVNRNIKIYSLKIDNTEYNIVKINNKNYILIEYEKDNNINNYLINISDNYINFFFTLLDNYNEQDVTELYSDEFNIIKNIERIEVGRILLFSNNFYKVEDIIFNFGNKLNIILKTKNTTNNSNKNINLNNFKNIELLNEKPPQKPSQKPIKKPITEKENVKLNTKVNINIDIDKIYKANFKNYQIIILDGNYYIDCNTEELIKIYDFINKYELRNLEEIKYTYGNINPKDLPVIKIGTYVYKKSDINGIIEKDIKKTIKNTRKKVEDIKFDNSRSQFYLVFKNDISFYNPCEYSISPYPTKNGINIFNEVIIKDNKKREKKIINNIDNTGNPIIYYTNGKRYTKNGFEKYNEKKHLVRNSVNRSGYLYGKKFKVGDFVYLTTEKEKKKYVVVEATPPTFGIPIVQYELSSNPKIQDIIYAEEKFLRHFDILKVGNIVRIRGINDSNRKIISKKKDSFGILKNRKTIFQLEGKEGLWFQAQQLEPINIKKEIAKEEIKYNKSKKAKSVIYNGKSRTVESVNVPRFYGNIKFKLRGIRNPVSIKKISGIKYNESKGIRSTTNKKPITINRPPREL